MNPIGLTVAIAVPDLDDAAATFMRLLGAGEPERASSPADGVDVATFHVGDGRIQLVAPTNDEGPIAKHLSENGPGVHHMGLLVERMDDATSHLADLEIRTLGSPRPGAEGRPVLFLHPATSHGALIELLDVGPDGETN